MRALLNLSKDPALLIIKKWDTVITGYDDLKMNEFFKKKITC